MQCQTTRLIESGAARDEDKGTIARFDKETPSYCAGFYSDVLTTINACAREADYLVDIGCGTWSTLQLIRDRINMARLWG